MPTPCAYDWAVIRVVPRVEREEFVNVGVVVFCAARSYLGAKIEMDEGPLRSLDHAIDLATVFRHLRGIRSVVEGDPAAGPVALMSPSERFHWLTTPRNTVLQPSPVHTGLCDDPAATLDRLFRALVLR